MTNPIGAITGSQVAYTAAKAAQPTQLPTNTTNLNQLETDTVSFKGKGKGEKSNTAAKVLLGIVSAATLIAGGYKCYTNGVGKNIFTKILDGGKKYWNQGYTAVKDFVTGKGKIRKTIQSSNINQNFVTHQNVSPSLSEINKLNNRNLAQEANAIINNVENIKVNNVLMHDTRQAMYESLWPPIKEPLKGPLKLS